MFIYFSFTGFWATVMYPTCVNAVVVYDVSPGFVCVCNKKHHPLLGGF